jgi:hypothetical protein
MGLSGYPDEVELRATLGRDGDPLLEATRQP